MKNCDSKCPPGQCRHLDKVWFQKFRISGPTPGLSQTINLVRWHNVSTLLKYTQEGKKCPQDDKTLRETWGETLNVSVQEGKATLVHLKWILVAVDWFCFILFYDYYQEVAELDKDY